MCGSLLLLAEFSKAQLFLVGLLSEQCLEKFFRNFVLDVEQLLVPESLQGQIKLGGRKPVGGVSGTGGMVLRTYFFFLDDSLPLGFN